MSNNDLYCDKCKSQHHPVECPKMVSVDAVLEVIKEAEKESQILVFESLREIIEKLGSEKLVFESLRKDIENLGGEK